jgi:hypothetical protein
MSNPNDPYQSPKHNPLAQQPGHQSSETISPLDVIIPTNPLAAIACWSGIIGLLFCFPCGLVFGPLALGTGLLALKKFKVKESRYGAATSSVRIWIGIITGGLGTLLGIVFLIFILIGSLGG